MKIVCISDTHNQHNLIDLSKSTADMIIHAGDSTVMGSIKEVAAFANWWNKLNFKYKVLIAGNHDFLFEKNKKMAEDMFENTYVLQDSGVEIEGLKFYGTPIVPCFGNWAFMPHKQIRIEHFKSIPDDVNVLITHTPPFGRLDNYGFDRIGCEVLLDRVLELKELKLHVFGHIHSGHGKSYKEKQGVWCVNAAQLDNGYNVCYKPIYIEV